MSSYDPERYDRERELLKLRHEQTLAELAAKARNQDRWWRRRFTTLCAVAVALIVVVSAGAFPWGGEEWGPREGVAFVQWQREHGGSPARFARNHPELAATFRGDWPTDHLERLRAAKLKTCASPACADDVIRAVFPDRVEKVALAVARCESTLNPRAVGDPNVGYSYGLFQIHWPSWGGLPWVGSQDDLLRAWHNATVALRISGGGTDWRPWTCARLLGYA